MNHQSNKKTLSLKRDQRRALLKSLAQSLILHEKMVTTETKAKVVRSLVEKMVTHAKKQDVATIRLLRRSLSDVAVKKLFRLTSQRYMNRAGGYIRLIKLPARIHDAASQAIVSFTE